MTRAKSCESEEMIKLRQELEALRNENLQMKNNAQHFPQIEPDHEISSQNRHANVPQPTALLHQNVYTGTTLPETQQRPTYSYTNTTLPETQQRPTYSYTNTTMPETQQRPNYSYTNTTMPEIQQRPNYSYTSTMPEIQQHPNYLQYPNNSTVPNWLPRQQYSGSQQQHSGLQNFENSKQDNGRRTRVPFYNGRDP
ncbi:unnamed protein product [Mytilus coruscus]|uniref:Uncharacterized protein n=1 Tax=Mytilus coruscus TaxID=42192 RepID=A0A6J8D707_MYTCO|nr:unnamed protein product [Mytilus coruscus]